MYIAVGPEKAFGLRRRVGGATAWLYKIWKFTHWTSASGGGTASASILFYEQTISLARRWRRRPRVVCAHGGLFDLRAIIKTRWLRTRPTRTAWTMTLSAPVFLFGFVLLFYYALIKYPTTAAAKKTQNDDVVHAVSCIVGFVRPDELCTNVKCEWERVSGAWLVALLLTIPRFPISQQTHSHTHNEQEPNCAQFFFSRPYSMRNIY